MADDRTSQDTVLVDRRILVVEDDPVLRDILTKYFLNVGGSVEAVADGFAALDAFGNSPADLVVLDRMLPGIDGAEVCRRLRQISTVPIMLLTAMGQQDERIAGLEAGADDYVTKPVAPREVILRAASILRRTAQDAPPEGAIVLGRFMLHPAQAVVTAQGESLPLTSREYDLFAFLLRRPDRVHSREQLMRGAWGWEHGDRSVIAVNMRRLRDKVEQDPSAPTVIRTVWGRGYLLDSAGAQ